MLTQEELQIIRHYAGSNKRELRPKAVAIYKKHIAEHVKSDRNKCPEMEFMSECESPCPDYRYKADLRRRILKALDVKAADG